MNAVAKTKIESLIANRVGHVFDRHARRPLELFPTGIATIDTTFGGFPRGAITELYGAESCGRTSLWVSALVAATLNDETCALVDCGDTFDLSSSAKAGVNFERLLWVRCNDRLESAFKAVDLLLHGGGFGFIVLNLADTPAKTLRRIISTWWFRFRRAIENTTTVLVVTTPTSCVRSRAAMALELKHEGVFWSRADSLVGEEQERSLVGDRSAPRLRLVAAKDRHERQPPNVRYFPLLDALTVCVNRKRPLVASDRTIYFQ